MLTQNLYYIDLWSKLIFVTPAKAVRVKANPKTWFDNGITSAIHGRNKLEEKLERSVLETDVLV